MEFIQYLTYMFQYRKHISLLEVPFDSFFYCYYPILNQSVLIKKSLLFI